MLQHNIFKMFFLRRSDHSLLYELEKRQERHNNISLLAATEARILVKRKFECRRDAFPQIFDHFLERYNSAHRNLWQFRCKLWEFINESQSGHPQGFKCDALVRHEYRFPIERCAIKKRRGTKTTFKLSRCFTDDLIHRQAIFELLYIMRLFFSE